MRKASFTCVEWVGYENVPIPDHLTKSSDIFEYIIDHIDEFENYKSGNFELMEGESPYQVILEDEDGKETTITKDDD